MLRCREREATRFAVGCRELDPLAPLILVFALWCFSLFGRRAPLATAVDLPSSTPKRPLRTNSLLHIAIARGDHAAALAQLKAGVPVNLLARDGLSTLHWALGSRDRGMPAWLLDRGCEVDVRSDVGATPLMNAAQQASEPLVRQLIARGASVNARDLRGSTALHRAAGMGLETIVRVLLDHGADRSIIALGETALGSARTRGHEHVARLLE